MSRADYPVFPDDIRRMTRLFLFESTQLTNRRRGRIVLPSRGDTENGTMTTEHHKQTTQHRARTAERRAVTQETVQKLITERTEMLALYCQMAGLEPYKNSKNSRVKPSQEMLQKFCQVLVDYIAAGHFSLYERIVNGTERRQQVSTLAEKLYPQIADSTEAALDFNDKYDCGEDCEISASFADDLSQLGEKLASRIELEDKLIQQSTQNLSRRDITAKTPGTPSFPALTCFSQIVTSLAHTIISGSLTPGQRHEPDDFLRLFAEIVFFRFARDRRPDRVLQFLIADSLP